MNAIQKLFLLFSVIALLLPGILSLFLFTKNIPADTYVATDTPPAPVETAAEPVVIKDLHEAGKILFKENCKSCHRVHLESVGPALFGITERRPRKWLYAFIQNPSRLISKGDTMAVNVYNKYKKAEMVAFPALTNTQIDSILVYIESLLPVKRSGCVVSAEF